MRAKEILNEDWQKVNKSDKTDGMSSKAVKAYRRENPGSKLKTAVTTKPSKLKKGSKSAKRRKSFCSRMSGMKKAHASAKTKRDPDSPINKALRRWNCESLEQGIEQLEQQLTEAKKKAGQTVPNCVPKESVEEGKTTKQEPPKPRNFVAKNATTSGAGAHKDKKKAEKQGDVKHKGKMLDMAEDAEPMDREFALVKKLGRLGERIVQNPKLWDKYSEVVEGDDPDWIISLIQDGTGATYKEVLRLSDLFGEIGGGLGRIIDFAWAVKEGTWEKDFLNPYRQHRIKWDMAEGKGAIDMMALAKRAKELLAKGMSEQQAQDALVKEGVPPRLAAQAVQMAQMSETISEKASRGLCTSSTPDKDLGASNLASCKSQGLRARDGEKSHLITAGKRKVRVTVGGKKIKGRKYGGPLPDYGTRK